MNAIAISQTQSIESSFSVPVFQGTINGVDESLVDARTLHKVLQVGKTFAAWIRNRIDEYSFIENQDFVLAIQNGKAKQHGGHNKKDYHLSLDMAKELAMIEKTDIGRMVRRYFIQCERIANKLTGRTTTADDRTGLRHAVDAMVTKKGLLYPDVYRLVHQRFNVEHIDELTLEQVGEATEYLHRLMLDIEKPLRVTFDKRAVESIVAVCHHVAFLRSWWDYYGEAIRKLNSNVAFCIHDHFTHANLHAGIIHSRTDLDFKLAQNMKDYPWEADYFTRQEFWRALPAK